MSGPQVYLTWPKFSLIPDALPLALPPPTNERSIRAPFGIDSWLFNAALKPELPFTFAALYIITVFGLNAYNRKRNHKPWWIAKQPCFQWFVVAHNAFLTIYSAATFLAMLRAIVHTWPGLNTDTGLAGVADALCKMHGPRGLGDAAAYNTTINIWEAKNRMIKLTYDGTPDPTDVGRLWNEGLAFWGWFFYISKFYEVIDTLIIVAKGKRSATLQTYHHSGAMLCMWAGIRYMSPPIWMFVFVNSFIHALMYTYFTLSALGIRVPTTLKRTLTSMQIAQLLWGTTYAAAHLFVKYDIPITTPYQIASTVQSAISSVSSAASSAVSAASSTASHVLESPAASGTLIALAKKLLLRAVGEEGIAERVTNNQGQYISPGIEQGIEQFNDHAQHQAQSVQQKARQVFETRWRTDWTKTNCIDTSGEAFAIYLNLLYLAPLTFLFVRFFVKAYLGRGKARRASHAARQVSDSGNVAADRTAETVEKAGRRAEEEIIKAEAELHKLDPSDVHEQLRRDVASMKNGTWGRENRRVSDHVQNFERQVKSAAESVKERSKKAASNIGSPQRQSASKKSVETTEPKPEQSQDATTEAKPEQHQDVAAEAKPAQAQDVTPESKPAQQQDTATAQSTGAVEKQEVAKEAAEEPSVSSQSTQEQEQNLQASEPTRPGGETEDVPVQHESTATLGDGMTYSDVVREGTEHEGDMDFSQSSLSDSRTESQSELHSTSQTFETSSQSEPQGESVFGFKEEDTDAMGKSGAILDYAAEKAEEAADKAEEALSGSTDH